MKTKPRWSRIVFFGLTFFFPELHATVRETGPETAFRNVSLALKVFAEDNQGQIASTWEELGPYLEEGVIQRWLGMPAEEAILLLENANPAPRIDGKRVIAILLVPSEGGKHWAVIEDAEKFISPAVFDEEEVRTSGIDLTLTLGDPESSKSQKSLPLSETERGDKGTVAPNREKLAEKTSSLDNAEVESFESECPNLSKLALAVIFVVALGILLLLIWAFLRSRGA